MSYYPDEQSLLMKLSRPTTRCQFLSYLWVRRNICGVDSWIMNNFSLWVLAKINKNKMFCLSRKEDKLLASMSLQNLLTCRPLLERQVEWLINAIWGFQIITTRRQINKNKRIKMDRSRQNSLKSAIIW